ncbi:MAG: hypothetical protein GY792_15065 [Gammaproteobacteria bacterium]|nr:hypothetical protein [Gammaproteobacteria bacterium]
MIVWKSGFWQLLIVGAEYRNDRFNAQQTLIGEAAPPEFDTFRTGHLTIRICGASERAQRTT